MSRYMLYMDMSTMTISSLPMIMAAISVPRVIIDASGLVIPLLRPTVPSAEPNSKAQSPGLLPVLAHRIRVPVV